ncbi:MAG: sensor histidine kinase N-terminal domain-containing protein [Gallionellaceae bacterium]|nr:sensor histidine kinase N-terminal domain-containing protein [Gallionellaceae bacterium]
MRLILLALAIVSLFSLATGYAILKSAEHETEEIFDAQLTHFAQGLLSIAAQIDRGERPDGQAPDYIYRHHHQWMLAFQVWRTGNGQPRLLLHSEGAEGMADAKMPAEGFSAGTWRGESWRYYRQRDEEHGLDVLVGQDSSVLEEMAQEVAWRSIFPLLCGVPVLMAFLLLAIRFGLRPLRQLANVLRGLAPERLSPVSLNDEPKEITPVVKALNDLLQRIDKAMENERRFTADASHELRTPLAALQAQIQAAQLADNAGERNESLNKAVQGAERMGHLVGQLLTLSRLDNASATLAMEDLNLNALAQDVCAELGVAAVARNIEIGLDAQTNVTLRGFADMLHILLRNLLDNAIRYTPQGGRVEVTLRTVAGQTELDVSDSGAGVPDEWIARLGQRFHRLDPGAADGVGLGLSIVQRIAEIHRANVTFSRATQGGLSVTVRFPAR